MLIREALQGHDSFSHELPSPAPALRDFPNLVKGNAALQAMDRTGHQ